MLSSADESLTLLLKKGSENLNQSTLIELSRFFSRNEVIQARNAALEVQQLELSWLRALAAEFDGLQRLIVEHIARTGELPPDAGIDFESFLTAHAFEIEKRGFEVAASGLEAAARPARLSRTGLSTRTPRSLRELMRMWDHYRQNGVVPPRQRELADRIKKAYLKRVKTVWQQHSQDFRSGTEADQYRARQALRDAARMPYARAKMIVETETTHHYNQARRAVYDESDDVTHYLFLAIRDHATTNWCRTRNGLVYRKDSKYLEAETPPCFRGDSPVLTQAGWKRIDCIGTADLVWTHGNRWKRVTKIHVTPKKNQRLLQIGFAMATPNHPYFERGIGFVAAQHFRPEKGIWAGTVEMQELLKNSLGAMVQSGQKILFDPLPHQYFGSRPERQPTSVLERREEAFKVWLRGDFSSGSPALKPPGLCFGAFGHRGEHDRQIPHPDRGCPPQERDQDRQPSGESASDDAIPTYQLPSPESHIAAEVTVYNLEVEDDHTYFCGGFLVHNCHWNCRSEILPLLPKNPRHLQLIRNESLWRENRRPAPLLPGWNRRSA